MKFRLRTLLILLAVGPVVLAVCWNVWIEPELKIYRTVNEDLEVRMAELQASKSIQDPRHRKAGERHAQLMYDREREYLRTRPFLFRALTDIAP